MGSIFKMLSPVAMVASSGGGSSKTAAPAQSSLTPETKRKKSTLLDETKSVSPISEKSSLV